MRGLFRLMANGLDLFVAPAFSAPGFALRKRAWEPETLPTDLSGQQMIVTGANSGLGYATSEDLAGRGATIHMLCRNKEKGEAAQDRILKKCPEATLHLHIVDVSLCSEILGFVQSYQRDFDRVDGLILNAGVLLGAREETNEGVEKSFATNVLGPYLLCRELEPLLVSGEPSRVIFVSSGGMYTQKLDVDDFQFERKSFDGVAAYAQNKRAEVILTELFAELWRDKAVTVNAMHPGWADTPGVQSSLPIFRALTSFMLRDAKQGADTIIWLACSETVKDKSGMFFFDRLPRRTRAPFSKTESSVEDRAKLWDYCENLAQSLSNGEVKPPAAG